MLGRAPHRWVKWLRWLSLAWMVIVLVLLVWSVLALGTLANAATPSMPAVRIPQASVGYRLQIERASAEHFGLDASPARLAAQIHQESGWRPGAQSAYALGLAQFTPDTAKWLPSVCPSLFGFDPWDASQSIRAAACYDRWLYERVQGATPCDRWAFTLSAYNSGLGWVQRDKRRALASGADPARWFEHVDAHSARAGWALKENRGYITRILLRLEPAYIEAGWDGVAVCP